MDSWAGAVLEGLKPIDLGVGLAVSRVNASRTWRASGLLSPDRIGVGVSRTVVPVIEITIGAGALCDLDHGKWSPVVYGTIYRF